MALGMTPSQTIGPLYGFALMFEGSEHAVDPADPEAIRVEGRVLDGDGAPVAHPECMLELWKGDVWARTRTDADGRFRATVRRPSPPPLPDGRPQAPHLEILLFARGLLKQAHTRLYFPDEEAANAADPVLEQVAPGDRHKLIARADGDGLRLDIHLMGPSESVFFDV